MSDGPWVVLEQHRMLEVDEGIVRGGILIVGPFPTDEEAAEYQNWTEEVHDLVMTGRCAMVEVPMQFYERKK